MKELITFSYDITDEVTSGDIKKIAELVQMSKLDEQTRKADIPSQWDMNNLSEDECALVLYHPNNGQLKKYANYNRELTELNTLCFLNKASHLPDEICKTAAHFLLRARRAFNLESSPILEKLAAENLTSNLVDLTKIDQLAYQIKLATKNAEVTKTELTKLAKEEFALPNKRKYPISNAKLIKTAMTYFNNHHKKFGMMDKLAFAVNTVKAAKAHKLELTGMISKYAELDPSLFNDDFKYFVKSRIDLTTNEHLQGMYSELVTKSAEIGSLKTAKVLEELDKRANLEKHWNQLVPDPLFSVLKPSVEESIEIEGHSLTKSALLNLCTNDLSHLLSNKAIIELQGENGLQKFASLPAPTKKELIKLVLKTN